MIFKLLTLLLLTASVAFGQADKKLTKQIQSLVTGFNGTAGIYVQNLKSGKTAFLNADTLFPTA